MLKFHQWTVRIAVALVFAATIQPVRAQLMGGRAGYAWLARTFEVSRENLRVVKWMVERDGLAAR